MGSERFLKSTHKKLNEAGMTLVEILAALVILGIVFIGFMTIFPQMTSFNEKTETKLVTMNLARAELSELKEKIYTLKEFDNQSGYQLEGGYWIKTKTEKPDIDIIYKTIYKIKKDPEPSPVEKTDDNQVWLHRVQIVIFKNDKQISETFGYIKIK